MWIKSEINGSKQLNVKYTKTMEILQPVDLAFLDGEEQCTISSLIKLSQNSANNNLMELTNVSLTPTKTSDSAFVSNISTHSGLTNSDPTVSIYTQRQNHDQKRIAPPDDDTSLYYSGTSCWGDFRHHTGRSMAFAASENLSDFPHKVFLQLLFFYRYCF